MKIGAQLYTVRKSCETLEALDETLKKVADIGYTAVQLSGVCDYDCDWMAEKLRKYGLRADITHFKLSKIIEDTDATIAFHKAMGTKYIGVGSVPNFKKSGCNMTLMYDFMDKIAPAVDRIYESGCKFMYHNHNMEFINLGGKNVLDLLCERFPADRFGITLDTYWVQAGGADPAFWLRKLKGRVNCVHFKDMVYSGTDLAVRMAPIGQGNMNYPEILRACDDSDVEFAYVEQDHCYDEDPFDCLKKSYDYLNSFGIISD